MMRPFEFVFSALVLAGCATSAVPYGEFDGFNNRNVTDADLADVVVMAVDGKFPFESNQGVVSLTPGVHLLSLASSRDIAVRPSQDTVLHPSRDTVHGRAPYIETLIKVEPCRRYMYRAKHDSRLPGRPWELVPAGEAAVAGCKAPPPPAPAQHP